MNEQAINFLISNCISIVLTICWAVSLYRMNKVNDSQQSGLYSLRNHILDLKRRVYSLEQKLGNPS